LRFLAKLLEEEQRKRTKIVILSLNTEVSDEIG